MVFTLAGASCLQSTSGSAEAAKRGARKAAGKESAKTAAAAEIDKLKGDFKWGMTSSAVIAKVEARVADSYEERLKKAAHDPSSEYRIRKAMRSDVDKVKERLVKFEGEKTGYDVSIIDEEFLHGTGEAMLVGKEDNATRYFFFADDRLYKMFLAFDKEMLQGKSFREFGQLMQARFGKAREVTMKENTKSGPRSRLDHFVWAADSGDRLRLVDRSEFYDVFCLVVNDGKIAERQETVRRARRTGPAKDTLVEAVTNKSVNDLDPNENILDQITGVKVKKLGEEQVDPIVVPKQNP